MPLSIFLYAKCAFVTFLMNMYTYIHITWSPNLVHIGPRISEIHPGEKGPEKWAGKIGWIISRTQPRIARFCWNLVGWCIMGLRSWHY